MATTLYDNPGAHPEVLQAALECVSGLIGTFWHVIQTFAHKIEAFPGGERCAPLGGTELENRSPSRSEEETSKAAYVNLMKSEDSGKTVNHDLGAVEQGVNTATPAGDSSEGPEPEPPRGRKAPIEPILFCSVRTRDDLIEIPFSPEESGATPTTGPLLDPADGGQPSKRQKTQSCSLAETDAKRDPDFGVNLLETLKREKTYEEIRHKYPSSDDDARKAVIEEIKKNETFGSKLLIHFKHRAPMRVLGENAFHRAFTDRINQIMKCEGKDAASLRDLIDLKYNLEDPQKRNEILTRYFDQRKR
jgi:hypothetical protein